MMTKLKSRVALLERDLPARRLVEETTGLPSDFDAEEYGRLLGSLYRGMPTHHFRRVADELSRMERRRNALRLAAREDPSRQRPPRRALVPRVRLSRLTLSLIGRINRALRGDQRPVALPARVCDVYLWAETYKRDDVPVRECAACGYDTPAPRTVNALPCLNVMGGFYNSLESYSPIVIISCPVCGDTLAPEGRRPWSDKNPDKVADVYVWPDGEVSVLD